MRPEIIINEPRGFDPHKFFYSRTDRRGIILSGSQLLFDVADYPREQLIGAPHKVVRHPDTPRGLFSLIWSTIQAGEPAIGFVKNLARDGRYYWVTAVVIPDGEGHLSICSAPAGALFEPTQAIYARMLKAEAAGMAPAESAAMLLSELQALGISSFAAYGAQVLAEKLREDDASCAVRRLMGLHKSITEVSAARGALMDTLRTLYLIPTNMRILASRLEPSGGPISAISDSYKRAAADLMTRLTGGPKGAPGRSGPTTSSAQLIEEAILSMCVAMLMQQAIAQVVTEARASRDGLDEETARLQAVGARYQQAYRDAQSAERLDDIMRSVRQVAREAEVLKRLMAGLDQIRILGEVESGRIRNSDSGLAAIMSQLTSFHGQIHSRLTTMGNTAARMEAMDI